MKTIKITTLLAALVLACNAQADGLYDIAFSDGGANNVGAGQIDVEGGYAISGYFDVTAGLAMGHYTLYTAGGTGGTYTAPLLSPAGAFNYDNVVYLTSNPQYPVNNPYLDLDGLLFTDAGNNEVNLWAGSDNNTSAYTFDAYIKTSGYIDPSGIIGPASNTPAPEPSSLALVALMLIPAGVFWRSARNGQLQS